MRLRSRLRLLGEVMADQSLLPKVIEEVLRYDAPVQNTRRFLACDGIVAGQAMNRGHTVLLVLAAANRDPAANPDPDCFDAFRRTRGTYTFGAGAHACPGEKLAVTMANAGISGLIDLGLDVRALTAMTYRSSANARIPQFATR